MTYFGIVFFFLEIDLHEVVLGNLVVEAEKGSEGGKGGQQSRAPDSMTFERAGLRHGGEHHPLEDAVKPYQLVQLVLQVHGARPLVLHSP